MNFRWTHEEIRGFDPVKLYKMIQLRINVFVVEQTCPYPELDHKDLRSEHLAAWDEAGECCACARLVPPGVSYAEPSVGRVATSVAYRGSGLGRELMKRAIRRLEEKFPGSDIRISAQSYLQDFYESFGFEVVSGEYLEDDIPHKEMLLKKGLNL